MSQNTICLDTELRKLRLRELCTLGQILNLSDSWKKLMAIVPKEESSDLPKFTSEHFSIIEQAAQQQKRNAAEIFLSEWGTMGKSRPTLRTLLDLLVKAQLFRAADYVAGDILKEELPQRPKCGPAAPVDISDDIIKKLLEEQEVGYNEGCTFQLPSNINDNKNINSNAMDKQMNNSSLERNMQSTKLVSTKEKHNEEQIETDVQQKLIEGSSREVSDLIKFSTERGLEAIPPPRTNNLQHVFGNQEMSSRELPIFLHEFRQTAEQARLNQEIVSDELPIFVNNRTVSSNTSSTMSSNQTSEISHSNINEYEMTSTELPRCIVELQRNSTTTVDNTAGTENNENLQQNVLNSQELPVMVLEYHK